MFNVQNATNHLIERELILETPTSFNYRFELNEEVFEWLSEICYNFPVNDLVQLSSSLNNFLTEDADVLVDEMSISEDRRLTLLNDADRTDLCFFHRNIVEYLEKVCN